MTAVELLDELQNRAKKDKAMRDALAAQIAQYPVCEYAFVKTEDLSFLEQVRHICKTDCPQYGKSWSCPPAVGTVQECKARHADGA